MSATCPTLFSQLSSTFATCRLLFVADLGIPEKSFHTAGITNYQSPFFDKFTAAIEPHL